MDYFRSSMTVIGLYFVGCLKGWLGVLFRVSRDFTYI